MAHRISKEDLDEQFEQFLRESLSDDSLGSPKKSSVLETLGQPKKKEHQNKQQNKQHAPWWITDDDSDDGVIPPKPSSASRSKTLEKFSMLEQFHKAKKDAVSDKEDEGSYFEGADTLDGMRGTSQSFLKTQRVSQRIEEEDEEGQMGKSPFQKMDNISGSITRDSLESDDTVVASGPNQNTLGMGLDTLEEQEEKEQFFAKLEKGASSTIDYSRLNKELDSADSIQFAALMRDEQNVRTEQDENKDEVKHEELSGNYSEDFEDEVEANPLSDEKEENQVKQRIKSDNLNTEEQINEKPGMLSKVLLLDSLESTNETQKLMVQQGDTATESDIQQGTNEMTGTGISHGQTNSDIEALYQAYHHIDQSLGETNQELLNFNTAEELVQDVLNSAEIFGKIVSTAESDLPTIEELMKPIGKDSACARDLPFISPVKRLDSSPPEFASPGQLKESQNTSAQKQQRLEDLQECQKIGNGTLLDVFTDDVSDGSKMALTTKEPWADKTSPRVLQQQDPTSVLQTHIIQQCEPWDGTSNNEAEKQALDKKVGSPASLLKKSQRNRYLTVKSSGYGKISSPVRPFSAATESNASKETIRKPNCKAKPLVDQTRQKGTLSATRTVKTAKNASTFKSDTVITCVQSNVKNPEQKIKGKTYVFKHLPHVSSVTDVTEFHLEQDSSHVLKSIQENSILLKRVRDAEEKWSAGHNLVQHLQAEFSEREKQLTCTTEEMKVQHEKEILQLKQEIYILQTKLHSREDTSKKNKLVLGKVKDPVNEEDLKQVQKEVQEQETLLQGYQHENEKLYKQVKELQAQNKTNEERMFKENLCLLAELSSLKEKVTEGKVQQHANPDSEQFKNWNFSNLISELRAAQKVETNLLEEIKQLKQDKYVLEVDMAGLRKERDLAGAKAAYNSGDTLYEMKIKEESYKQEISRLSKRLEWYAENQEILDKDTVRLRDANDEIQKLKLEVEKLRTEAGTQSAQQQKRYKDRAADAKRIQDLERQVKEMEGIIKRRHPNSLPALIFAAAAVHESDSTSAKPSTIAFLERRIKKLEDDLEGKDEEAKKSLRSMEQQFQKMKFQYEHRIMELEQLLAYKVMNEPRNLSEQMVELKAFEQELCNVKEAHKTTVAKLQKEIELLVNQNSKLELYKTKSEDEDLQSIEHQVEQAHAKARLVRLNQELAAKGKEVQELAKTVERLQKERMTMLSDQTSTKNKQKPAKKGKKEVSHKSEYTNIELFPETLAGKTYQPHSFADTHISEVLHENETLKLEIERLSEENSQQRVEFQAKLSQAENNIRRIIDDAAEHLAALKSSHQRELEKILCQHAVEHSSSKTAELNSKISTQEILIKHLQEQVTELQRDREALTIFQVREETLQNEVAKLLEELREAKESHSPEMKHFLTLETKLKHMEIRHAQRERELQQIIQQTRSVAEAEQLQEAEKWKQVAQMKNEELEKFRIELDSILDVLRELQRQGVVISRPVTDRTNN
ncbi:centrosomal protein of 162 kDa [Microcaecilia unicolor]|uniref:Centrosomal protein of 162 kDa n=1 Tax=Microcaecilia unicolor TaxID=1415580 RepID=A0A6P7XHM9_9AMPH|nr:centrosomal protein of 162 kDa [Microcaecilia unicolor]